MRSALPLTILSSLLTSVLSLPAASNPDALTIPRQTTPPLAWEVTNYNPGYTFDITIPPNGPEPGVSTSCTGTTNGVIKACASSAVSSKEVKSSSGEITLFVRYTYQNSAGETYTAHGNYTLVYPSAKGQSFFIIPGGYGVPGSTKRDMIEEQTRRLRDKV